MFNNQKEKNITLIVNDEKTLYSAFSPEDEFDESVKSYIRSKIAGMDYKQNVRLKVVSRNHIDEDRFRLAVSNWIRDEKTILGKKKLFICLSDCYYLDPL